MKPLFLLLFIACSSFCLGQNKIDIDFKTGGDNLEMKLHQKPVEVRIILQNRPEAILQNVNKDQNWPNNSIRRVTIALPADITAQEIKEIHVYRTPIDDRNVKYIWDLRDQDNWNLQSISAFATIKIKGSSKRFDFEPIPSSTRRGGPLYRFTYSSKNYETEGNTFKSPLVLQGNTLPAPVNTQIPVQNAKLEIAIGTGGDDLRGGNDNADVVLTFKSHPGKIYLRNIFNKRSLPNFSERKTTKEIENSTTIELSDIEEVEIHHSGGGGVGADNWDIDKVKITISKDGQSKVLVDRVGAPIHRFTGDTRIKRFVVP